MTLRSSDLQSDGDLDSIRNSCDVYPLRWWVDCVVAVWCSLFAWALWGLGFMAQQEAVCCFYATGYMVWEDADSSSVPTQKWMSCKFTSYHGTGCDLQIAMKRAFLCVCNGRHVLRALPANWCLKLDIKLVQVQAEPGGCKPKYKRAWGTMPDARDGDEQINSRGAWGAIRENFSEQFICILWQWSKESKDIIHQLKI